MVDHRATNVWHGDLQSGSGELTFGSAGTRPLPVTFASRAEEVEGQTSPEELIAAAHASDFNMAMASALSKSGHTPERLTTTAQVTFSMEGGPHVSGIALQVRASVPGISAAQLLEVAATAKEQCPVSKLVTGNTELTLDAALE